MTAQALETLRLRIGPFMSRRTSWSQLSRVSWRRPLPSAPSTMASGGAAVEVLKHVFRRLAVEAEDAEAVVLQFCHGAREVGDLHEGHVLIGAGRRLEEHGGGLRAVARRGHQRRHVEGRAGAQDGPDIVRVRHLVEQHDDAGLLDLVEARLGQRLGLQQQALVHGIRRPACGQARGDARSRA